LSSLIFRGFIIGFVSFFFFILGEIIISTAYSYVFDKKYKAKVISYNPVDDTQIPVVEFKDDQSRTIQLPLGHSVNNPKAIGTVIQVSSFLVLRFSELHCMPLIAIFPLSGKSLAAFSPISLFPEPC
jgi:hypothetical protein